MRQMSAQILKMPKTTVPHPVRERLRPLNVTHAAKQITYQGLNLPLPSPFLSPSQHIQPSPRAVKCAASFKHM